MMILEERVTTLEDILAQTLRTVEQTSRELREFKEESRQHREASERDMQAFKEEMRQHRETSQQEMQAFKEEMRQHREASEREERQHREASERDMQAFKEEMRQHREASERKMQVFREEMRQFRDRFDAEIQESQTARREMKIEMNRRWGEFSRIIGRMAEDLVAPSIPQILRSLTDCPEEQMEFRAIQVKKRLVAKEREFDVVAVCGDYVLINETKNRLRSEDIKNFAEKVLPTARDFFPEYAQKKFIGAIASLYVDERQVRDGERRGIIVLGFGQDVMEVLNSTGFVPKTF